MHFILNASLSKCLGSVSIKEVVMAKLMRQTLARNMMWMNKVTETRKDKDYYGDFSFNDCKIFGGVVAKAAAFSSDVVLLTFIPLLSRHVV